MSRTPAWDSRLEHFSQVRDIYMAFARDLLSGILVGTFVWDICLGHLLGALIPNKCPKTVFHSKNLCKETIALRSPKCTVASQSGAAASQRHIVVPHGSTTRWRSEESGPAGRSFFQKAFFRKSFFQQLFSTIVFCTPLVRKPNLRKKASQAKVVEKSLAAFFPTSFW